MYLFRKILSKTVVTAITRLLLLFVFITTPIASVFACTANFPDQIYPNTSDVTVTITCQTATCSTPAFYATDPLITYNSNNFDNTPWSGARQFTVNSTTNGTGQFIVGIQTDEGQCAAGWTQITAAPTPIPSPTGVTKEALYVSTGENLSSGLKGAGIGLLGIISIYAIGGLAIPAVARWGIRKFRGISKL